MKGNNGIFDNPIEVATDAWTDQAAISVDKSANAHIVYTNGNRYIRYINNVGGSFNENINVGWGNHPWIVVDEQGVAHIVYNQVSENMYAHNAEGTFQSVQINQTMPSYGGARGGYKFVTLSSDNFIHTVFQAQANKIFSELDHDIFYAKFPAEWNYTTPGTPSINLNRTILNFGATVSGKSTVIFILPPMRIYREGSRGFKSHFFF